MPNDSLTALPMPDQSAKPMVENPYTRLAGLRHVRILMDISRAVLYKVKLRTGEVHVFSYTERVCNCAVDISTN